MTVPIFPEVGLQADQGGFAMGRYHLNIHVVAFRYIAQVPWGLQVEPKHPGVSLCFQYPDFLAPILVLRSIAGKLFSCSMEYISANCGVNL